MQSLSSSCFTTKREPSQKLGWRFFAFSLAVALSINTTQAETRQENITGTTDITVNISGITTIEAGSEDKLVIEAEPDVLKAIVINRSGNKLTLESKGFKTKKAVNFKFTVKNLVAYKHTGSGDSTLKSRKEPNLTLITAGSGALTLQDSAINNLKVELGGAGDITLKGSGATALFTLATGGTFDAKNFKAAKVTATLEGSGELLVHATETLTATLNGAGNISYKGKPKVKQTINGAGSIDAI
jgi:Putative auto-transporter adhesin, head GIN domain